MNRVSKVMSTTVKYFSVRIHARVALLIIGLADCSFVPFLSQCYLLNCLTFRLGSANEKKNLALCSLWCSLYYWATNVSRIFLFLIEILRLWNLSFPVESWGCWRGSSEVHCSVSPEVFPDCALWEVTNPVSNTMFFQKTPFTMLSLQFNNIFRKIKKHISFFKFT